MHLSDMRSKETDVATYTAGTKLDRDLGRVSALVKDGEGQPLIGLVEFMSAMLMSDR